MRAQAARALWSHWRRNPVQLFTLLAGLVLATGLWCGVQAINAEARASYDAAASTLGEGQFDQLLPTDGEVIAQDTYIALRRAGWQVSPVLEGSLGGIRLVGLDPVSAPLGIGVTGPGVDGADFLDYLRIGPLFANAETAKQLADLTDRPIRIDAGIAPGTAVTDIGVAQDVLGKTGALTRLIVGPHQPLNVPPLDQIAPALKRLDSRQTTDIAALTDSFHLNLTAFGLLSFAVGIFIVHGTIGLAFEQRRSLIRTLRALGVPLSSLIAVMSSELLVISLFGGVIGVGLGYLVAGFLLPDVAATLRGLYGANVAGTLQLRPSWWASGLAICLVGTIVASAGAMIRIARMPVVTSGHARAWALASHRTRALQTGAAVLLLFTAAILAGIGGGLLAGFVLLGCLLIGAALLLPVLLDRVLKLGSGRARSVTWQWFWADTRLQLPGLSLALMALLLATAANIGVSTMVSSFRLTFVDFLDQRLMAELYVAADDAQQAAALETFLSSRADAVLPVMSVDTVLAGQPSELYGTRVGPSYVDNWAFLQSEGEAWQSVANGVGAIINEQLARGAGLDLGDPLSVGANVSLPVVGVVGDYGNPVGQVIISEVLFATLHPDVSATRFGVRTSDPEGLTMSLTDRFGLDPRNIIDQAGIKAFSLGVFERTFTVTDALNMLTLAVAGFAIFMSLLTLAAMRVPQMAPAWALGLPRKTLGRLELIRAMILAVLTAVFALPLGLALAWVLLAIVNVEAFGWRLPMFLFPLDYARLGLFALVAAAVAAAWPAMRLARTPPADLLKVFSNER